MLIVGAAYRALRSSPLCGAKRAALAMAFTTSDAPAASGLKITTPSLPPPSSPPSSPPSPLLMDFLTAEEIAKTKEESRAASNKGRNNQREETGKADDSEKTHKTKKQTKNKKQMNKGQECGADEVRITPVAAIWPPPYYFEDNLRRVRPYHWTYNTYCKERWRGKTLMEVFVSEFRDRPAEYYRMTMEKGDIFINGKSVGPDYVIQNGDLVSHTMHRHEPPVTAEPIGIIHEDNDMIVINKPSGVPVHPAGRYKFNSVLEIMMAERGPLFRPYPCNRLDRLTSGIMFVAKSVQAADKLGNQIKARTVRKEYVARVVGEFPEGDVVCDQPILSISPKLGLNRVRANGKSARTAFKRLAYYPPTAAAAEDVHDSSSSSSGGGGGEKEKDSGNKSHNNDGNSDEDIKGRPWATKKGYSIVRCLPVTGRTHQIRVHLQYLGHPIQNDPIYANQRVWGVDLGHHDADGTLISDEDVITRLSRMGKEEAAEAVVYYDDMIERYEKQCAEKMTGETCSVCDTPLYSDPGMHELSLWLHSLRYEDADGAWAYESELPRWAMPPEGMAGPTRVGGMEELVQAVEGMEDVEAQAVEGVPQEEGV